MPPSDDLLSDFMPERDVAAALGRSTRTLARWHDQRIGPPRIQVGRLVLYRKESLRDWLRAQEQRPVREARRKKKL